MKRARDQREVDPWWDTIIQHLLSPYDYHALAATNTHFHALLASEHSRRTVQRYEGHFRKVQNHPLQLAHIPLAERISELCWVAVTLHGWALASVPSKVITSPLCWTAVSNNGTSICYVPRYLLTSALCHAAVIQDAWAIEYVPSNFHMPAICQSVVDGGRWKLDAIDEVCRTLALCMAAVGKDWREIRSVPLPYHTFFPIAVSRNSDAPLSVPK